MLYIENIVFFVFVIKHKYRDVHAFAQMAMVPIFQCFLTLIQHIWRGIQRSSVKFFEINGGTTLFYNYELQIVNYELQMISATIWVN